VSLIFSFQDEPLLGPPPPSLPATARTRSRPLVPISVIAPNGREFRFVKAVMDLGADDTVFPISVARGLGLPLSTPTGHGMKWRGQHYPLRFADIELELADGTGSGLRWSATVAFTSAAIRYPLLGVCGVWEFLIVRVSGASRLIEVDADSSFPGTVF
jgi:hypothetical protein